MSNDEQILEASRELKQAYAAVESAQRAVDAAKARVTELERAHSAASDRLKELELALRELVTGTGETQLMTSRVRNL